MTRSRTRHWLVPALLALAWVFAGPPAASAAAKDTDSDADEPRQERGWLPVDLTLRHTQGGLSKADLHGAMSLGGGQVALDVRLGDLPLWVSLAGEYYKEYFPSAKETWEIEQLGALYLFYKTERLPRLRAELFAGLGVGKLTTGGDDQGTDEGAPVYEVFVGINRQVYKRWGLWVDVRHLRSQKERDQVRVVDFSSDGLMVGVTYNTAW